MRRIAVVFAAVMILATVSVMAADNPAGQNRTVSRQYGVTVDPTTGVVSVVDAARGQVTGDFNQTNAYCVHCGDPCTPPVNRHIVVELTAINAVGPQYYPGLLLATNSSLDNIAFSRKDPLLPNDVVTYTFDQTVSDCSWSFGIWFNMCQPGNPADPTGPCPP